MAEAVAAFDPAPGFLAGPARDSATVALDPSAKHSELLKAMVFRIGRPGSKCTPRSQ